MEDKIDLIKRKISSVYNKDCSRMMNWDFFYLFLFHTLSLNGFNVFIISNADHKDIYWNKKAKYIFYLILVKRYNWKFVGLWQGRWGILKNLIYLIWILEIRVFLIIFSWLYCSYNIFWSKITLMNIYFPSA